MRRPHLRGRFSSFDNSARNSDSAWLPANCAAISDCNPSISRANSSRPRFLMSSEFSRHRRGRSGGYPVDKRVLSQPTVIRTDASKHLHLDRDWLGVCLGCVVEPGMYADRRLCLGAFGGDYDFEHRVELISRGASGAGIGAVLGMARLRPKSLTRRRIIDPHMGVFGSHNCESDRCNFTRQGKENNQRTRNHPQNFMCQSCAM
jgi:hypothetical protein